MRCWPPALERAAPAHAVVFIDFSCGAHHFFGRTKWPTPIRVPSFLVTTVNGLGVLVVIAITIVDSDAPRYAGVNPIFCHWINPPKWIIFPQIIVEFDRDVNSLAVARPSAV